MSKFDDIMRHLNPKVILDKTEIPHDTARGKYILNSSIAKNYREYENIVIDYMAFHSKEIYSQPLYPEQALHKADDFLNPVGGLKEGAYVGLSGSEGGMVHIINTLNDGFKAEAKKGYFVYVLNTFVDPLAFDEVVEVMKGLKNKLSVYSPQSFQYLTPEAMAASYKEILWNYIHSLSKYKNIWKFY
ncbi:hypothetical protein JXC34_01195 [Candidatus Woesearchaeota archaeon]|nr:hypothetical protein [Candidatus Woesearchaeota archaeon]